ncbi:hypothetical protein [Palleronia rufa]|uniref:hypothetical protein n=1 Tax=Palleronia rufa TaxID=1530186 RepID=UPI00056908AB|nr:hypothetical protein [Palleronia rufa]
MRALFLLAPFALAGCTQYESLPVTLRTDGGQVTCQLYGINQVYFDTAISWPETMTEKVADGYCVAEGRRILNARR